MLRISSGKTWIHKKGFPIAWFGFLAVFVVIVTVSGAVAENLLFLVVPLAMAAFGFILFKTLVGDLVDEVLDDGDDLVVRNRGEEERIALADIMNVNASTFTNPPRVTLRLRYQSRFGDEITFTPEMPFTLNPFSTKNPVAEELILRIDRARSDRAGLRSAP
jgi:hypothetical protein